MGDVFGPIDFAEDSEDVRNIKAVHGAMRMGLESGSWTETQITNSLRTYYTTVRNAVLREAANLISDSDYLRSYTDDHMGDIHEAAWVLRQKAEETS